MHLRAWTGFWREEAETILGWKKSTSKAQACESRQELSEAGKEEKETKAGQGATESSTVGN